MADEQLNPVGCRCDCHLFLQPKFSKSVGIACKLCASNHWCSVCERNLDTQRHEEECPEGLHPLTEADMQPAAASVRWSCAKCGWWKAQAVACPQCHDWSDPSPAAPSLIAEQEPDDILDDERVDKELRRWQDAIRDKLIAMGAPDWKIDGAGCDSGDPLDFTLAEVGQGLGYFIDQLEELKKAK